MTYCEQHPYNPATADGTCIMCRAGAVLTEAERIIGAKNSWGVRKYDAPKRSQSKRRANGGVRKR